MKAYRVSGKFMMGDTWQAFTKEVVGESEDEVREVMYSRLGSKHRVKRAKIRISEVTEIEPGELTVGDRAAEDAAWALNAPWKAREILPGDNVVLIRRAYQVVDTDDLDELQSTDT